MKTETKIKAIGIAAILSVVIYFAVYVIDTEFKGKESANTIPGNTSNYIVKK